MRDYEELVDRLRAGTYTAEELSIILPKAADAIEEQLQKALDVVNDAHNEGYDVGYWAGRRDYEPKWISVEERLPEEGKNVLVCICANGKYDITRGWYDKKQGFCCWDDAAMESADFITHWMSLPEPPRGES